MSRTIGSIRVNMSQRRCRGAVYALGVCAAIELLLIGWLAVLGRDTFIRYVWTPDTSTYLGVTLPLVAGGTLTAGPRTLGYPLFLALGYFLGGAANGPYVAIAVQLLLNVGFTWGCWKLLERLAPNTSIALRMLATVFFSWASLGMSLYLMTDFLSALCFCVFLYGMLFWRTRPGAALSGGSLAVATLIRPTFTLFPLFLPLIAWLVGRCTSTIPKRDLMVYMACSFAATGLSVMYQYSYSGYLGTSPTLTNPIQETIYYGVVKHRAPSSDYAGFKRLFEQEVENRAGRAFGTLAPREREAFATAILREELAAHPQEIVINFVMNFVKYLFVPVESNVMRLTEIYVGEPAYFRYVRPIVGVMCLPVWILALVPPIGAPREYKMFYLIVMTCLAYVLGLSAIATGAGERYRFPVLMFMLPIMVWNLQSVCAYRQKIEYRSKQRSMLSS